jgi:hypothetical protein
MLSIWFFQACEHKKSNVYNKVYIESPYVKVGTPWNILQSSKISKALLTIKHGPYTFYSLMLKGS